MSERIYIKNMVCDRCILVVRQELDKLNMDYKSVQLGEVELAHKPTSRQIEDLKNNLLEDKDPKKGSLIITDGEANFSLQDRFKDFRKQKKDKFKNKQYLRNKKIVDRSTKEFQDLLRNKFVETAKKYLGVPYAKRFVLLLSYFPN